MSDKWPATKVSRWWDGPVASKVVTLSYALGVSGVIAGLAEGNILTASAGSMLIESVFWATRDYDI